MAIRFPAQAQALVFLRRFPGTTDAGNVVIDNVLRDNGLPGVTMHNHAAAPSPAPPVNLDDNVIVGNQISGNGADTADTPTSGPTGVNLFSHAPVWGTVISQNVFDQEAIDVAFTAPSGQMNVHLNNFSDRAIGVDNIDHRNRRRNRKLVELRVRPRFEGGLRNRLRNGCRHFPLAHLSVRSR